jgi:hypothetical protein
VGSGEGANHELVEHFVLQDDHLMQLLADLADLIDERFARRAL